MTWYLAERVAELAATDPHGLAIVDGRRRMTWARLSGRADAIVPSLHSRGLRAGDRAALAMPASAEAIAVLVALLRAGATVAPSRRA